MKAENTQSIEIESAEFRGDCGKRGGDEGYFHRRHENRHHHREQNGTSLALR
jgi:hypothetical protein